MIQAKSRGCFSSEFLVSHNGNALGHFRGKFFSESIQINLLERRKLELRKTAFLRSRFSLVDLATGTELATAARVGFFGLKWQLNLSVGAVLLDRGFFSGLSSRISKDGKVIGRVDVQNWCGHTWKVVVDDEIPIVDQLMMGLVHHVIRERQRRSD